MRIVTIIALNQAFINPMVIGLGEICLGRNMAPVTQLWLIFNQQVFFLCRVVGRVAIETADIATRVGRCRKVRLRMTLAVAAETAGAGLLPRLSLEEEYLRLVAATCDVFGSRTVATFTALMRRAAFRVQGSLPMGRFLPSVVNFLVTSLTGIRAHVLGGIG